MIHAIFKKSSTFLWAVLGVACLLLGMYRQDATQKESFNDLYHLIFTIIPLWLFLVIPLIIGIFKALALKRDKEEHYIKSAILTVADSWFLPLPYLLPLFVGFLLKIMKTDEITSICCFIYVMLCWLVSAADSTHNLSTTKLMIASYFLSPIVGFTLVQYNNKHSKEEVEKNLARAQSAITDGVYIEAINESTEAIGVCSKNEKEKYQLARCYYWRGKAYGLAGEHKKAIQDLEKAFDLGIGTGEAFLASISEELKNVRKLEQREDDEENEVVTTMKPKKKRKGRRMAHQDNKEQGIIKSCENCGAPMNEGAKFCSNCGNAVVAINSEESSLEKVTETNERIEEVKDNQKA